MRNLVFFLIFMFSSGFSLSDGTIEISEVSEISDIVVLDQELEQMVVKVRQCAAAGLASASDCYCQYPAKLAAIRKAYDRVARKYPSWTEGSIRWWDEGRSFSSNLYLRGIGQQLARPCT